RIRNIVDHIFPKVVLFVVREQGHVQAVPLAGVRGFGPAKVLLSGNVNGRREAAVSPVEVVGGEGNLFEVVDALEAGGGFTHFLHRGHQEADQDGNDGDHNQELDQGKPTSSHDTTPE